MAEAIFGPMPLTERGVACKIDANTAGTKICYANGNTVIVRDVANPNLCEAYTEHTHHVYVARFSPNGAYVASGDAGGKVRMWAYTHPEKLLKKETPVFAGQINDLSWDDEGKRIIACGDGGKAAHAKAFNAESGSALGEITSHTKPVLSCAYRPTKPYRVATAGQDFKVGIFVGPPFKFSHSHDHHTNFVQCIRYSLDGQLLCSVGSDKKIVLYAGDEAEFKSELDGHDGGVYACAWDPVDKKTLMTCSADKTVKLWDVEAGKNILTFNLGEGLKGNDSQQVCCLYAGKIPMSLGLGGDLSYLDPSSGKVSSIVQAHATLPSSISFDIAAKKEPTIFVGTLSGSTYSYSSDGIGKRLGGEHHTGNLVNVSVSAGIGYSSGFDDKVRAISAEKGEYSGESVAIGKQPANISIAVSDPTIVATCTSSSVILIRSNAIACMVDVKYEPTCCALSPDATLLAVGHKDKGVHIFKVNGDKLEPDAGEIKGLFNSVTVMKFSPDGKFLAVGDKHKEISLWATDGWANVVKDIWVFHQASVTDICFSPDGKFLVSGSIDNMIYVWNVAIPMKKTKIAFAHPGGVYSVAFGHDGYIYSCGADNCIRKWKPKMPE